MILHPKKNIKASTRKDVTSSSENATPEDSVIYADFSEMAKDLEYQQEALAICNEFALADWEALQLGESEQ